MTQSLKAPTVAPDHPSNRPLFRAPGRRDVAISAVDQSRLKELVQQHGERLTYQHLGVARTTFLRACAGLPLLRGSVVMIHAALERPWGERSSVVKAL